MRTNLRVSSLIPIGLIVDDVTRIDNTIFVTARCWNPDGDVPSVWFALSARS